MFVKRSVRRALPLLLAAGAACTAPGVVVKGVAAPAHPGAREGDAQLTSSLELDGVDLVPLSIDGFVFGGPTDRPQVQPPSEQLARVPVKHPLLRVFAL